MPEGVNTTFFDPDLYSPIDLPRGQLVFGGNNTEIEEGYASSPLLLAPADGTPFRFISTFKWEHRKGWDVLLQVRKYLQYEF